MAAVEEKFKKVQEAYETLSDPAKARWARCARCACCDLMCMLCPAARSVLSPAAPCCAVLLAGQQLATVPPRAACPPFCVAPPLLCVLCRSAASSTPPTTLTTACPARRRPTRSTRRAPRVPWPRHMPACCARGGLLCQPAQPLAPHANLAPCCTGSPAPNSRRCLAWPSAATRAGAPTSRCLSSATTTRRWTRCACILCGQSAGWSSRQRLCAWRRLAWSAGLRNGRRRQRLHIAPASPLMQRRSLLWPAACAPLHPAPCDTRPACLPAMHSFVARPPACLPAQVDAFYEFWYTFRSWREFPHPDEEDVEGVSLSPSGASRGPARAGGGTRLPPGTQGRPAERSPARAACSCPAAPRASPLPLLPLPRPLLSPPPPPHTHQAEGRDHRRWIERYNKKLREAGKKEEFRRVRDFVDCAYRQDPR